MGIGDVINRRRFRWAVAVGFALTLFFTLWLLALALGLLQHGLRDLAAPMPLAYVVVGGASLVASIVVLFSLLFGYVFHGADLAAPTPRYLLFGWTCTGCLFFLSQSVALAKFGARSFPHVPSWLSELYWYFVPAGAVVFALLLWVNAEGHHHLVDWDDPAYDDATDAIEDYDEPDGA